MKKPDFILAGCARCGSTSLYRYLQKHPMIIKPKKKELNFFNEKFDKGYNYYLNLFNKAKKNQLSFEASINYFSHPNVPKRIFDFKKDIKLIFLFRNPVDRCYSHYYLLRRTQSSLGDFNSYIENNLKKYTNNITDNIFKYHYPITRGIYYNQLLWWLKYFSKDQMCIIKSEDLFKNPNNTYNKILEFLNIDLLDLSDFKRYNPISKSPHGQPPEMNEKIKAKLTKFYKNHNEKFYSLIDRDMKW